MLIPYPVFIESDSWYGRLIAENCESYFIVMRGHDARDGAPIAFPITQRLSVRDFPPAAIMSEIVAGVDARTYLVPEACEVVAFIRSGTLSRGAKSALGRRRAKRSRESLARERRNEEIAAKRAALKVARERGEAAPARKRKPSKRKRKPIAPSRRNYI